jgi:aerobic-type carbon monoxide dehydrogenase small subunit (CoxS/CutS family)
MAILKLTVDGREHTLEAEPAMPLLYALRDDIGLKNPRFGCGLAQCGACTVLMDGQPVRACVTPVVAATGKITTLEGIGTLSEPHPVQQAFIDEQAAFCGFCINGWILYAVALLDANPEPSDTEIRNAFAGLKCRCGAHSAILRAVKRAAIAIQDGKAGSRGRD